MKRFIGTTFLWAGVAILTNAQSINYNDVIVLANSEDSISMQIATYFAQQRGIVASHVITFPMPSDETINGYQFDSLRQALDSVITARNLRDSFAYIVTTKGMPLRISVDTLTYYAGQPYGPFNASVESELALMFSPQLASYVGDSLAVLNPYYGSTAPFNPSNNLGIRLVTRLDGYTYADVIRLIDSSGPNQPVDKSSAVIVIDRDPVWDSLLTNFYLTYYSDTDTLWDDYYDSAVSALIADGWSVIYDKTTSYLTQQSEVIAYNSWGSNDYSFGPARNDTSAVPNHQWARGALSVWYVSTSGRSFTPGTPYGQSLVADLINEGVSGTVGHVFEPFFGAMPALDKVFPNYLRSDRYLNLAEAFYSSIRWLSWMSVVIGDPKTSVMTTVTGKSFELSSTPHFSIFPNPVRRVMVLTGRGVQSGGLLEVYDIRGQRIRQIPIQTNHYSRIALTSLPKGFYFARLITPTGNYAVQSFVKQ